MNIETIPIELLNPDPNQPRKSWPEADEVEMSNSLINIGQQVPLIVFKDADKNIVADGERRLRAGKAIGRSPYTVRSWLNQCRLKGRKRSVGRGKNLEWEIHKSELDHYKNHGRKKQVAD